MPSLRTRLLYQQILLEAARLALEKAKNDIEEPPPPPEETP
jgi:hypothetical protein